MRLAELQKYSAEYHAVLEKIHKHYNAATGLNAMDALEIAMDAYPELGYVTLDFLQKYSDTLELFENE